MKKGRTFGGIEVGFDLLYLAAALVMGVLLVAWGRPLYGAMALVLVAGDSFHLIPRIQTALRPHRVPHEGRLGAGKMLTSIGMTVFYVLLWQVGLEAFPGVAPGWTAAVYLLAAARVALCLLPQNRWGQPDARPEWNLYRNLPFVALGALVWLLFFRHAAQGYPWMWVAILLSFACYLPVVFAAERYPMLGMLMLPKSCAYLWIIAMGFFG